MSQVFTLGAVAYDPKVVTIWTGFRDWFLRHEFPFDYLLYSHYERQVEELLSGHIQAAWNSPLAWVRARRLAEAQGTRVHALAMRDTDRDLTSVVVVRADSPVQSAADLGGKVVGVGAVDSSRYMPRSWPLLAAARPRRASTWTRPRPRRRGRSARGPHRRRARGRARAGSWRG